MKVWLFRKLMLMFIYFMCWFLWVFLLSQNISIVCQILFFLSPFSLRKCVVEYNTTIYLLLLHVICVIINFCLEFKHLLKHKFSFNNPINEIKIGIFTLRNIIILYQVKEWWPEIADWLTCHFFCIMWYK